MIIVLDSRSRSGSTTFVERLFKGTFSSFMAANFKAFVIENEFFFLSMIYNFVVRVENKEW